MKTDSQLPAMPAEAHDSQSAERGSSSLQRLVSPPCYLYSNQGSLWGERQVSGFGNYAFRVVEIEKAKANAVIVANHYSKKTATDAHTRLCYAVEIEGRMVGVLQFGYAMNPASCSSVVDGAGLNDYLELNRMWLDDCAPRNTESKAIAYCLRTIRRRMPTVEWVMSFADERCGKLGVVYQAANFRYYGGHVTTFWEINGEMIHNAIATNGARKRKDTLDMENATRHDLRQFRYIYWIQPRARKRCLLKEQPYPKHAAEVSMETRSETIGESGGQFPDAAPISPDAQRANDPSSATGTRDAGQTKDL